MKEIGWMDESFAEAAFRIPTAIPFGGVPIIVPIPPIEADQAIPSIRAVPNFERPGVQPSAPRMPSPSGSIIAVVAVFEIHIDRNAVTLMTPRRIAGAPEETPFRVSVQSVSRRSIPHFWRAAARRKL